MADLSPNQKRIALITGALLYVAAMAGLFGWLAFNGEDTVQNRIAHTPSVTVSLVKKPPEVPPSWTGDQQAQAIKPPETVPPVAVENPAEASKPLEKTAEQKPPEKTPVKQAEKPSEKPAEAAPQQATAPPAVQTNPVSQADAGVKPVWKKYARPFNQASTKPRIALIISDLGLAVSATQSAVQDLPGEVTLAFSSQTSDVDGWIAKARAAGHESLITIPMEPEDYPKNDPGPNTLLISLSDKDNVSRVDWVLARTEGYVGVMPSMGEKFVTAENKLAPVLDDLKQHELMIVDSTHNRNSLISPLSRLGHVPFARSDLLIDASASRDAIDVQLSALEKLATEKGQAIGIALPYPVTFEKLKTWIATLDKKGIVLAPVTALASEDITAPAATMPSATAPVTPSEADAPKAAALQPVPQVVADPAKPVGGVEIPVAKGPLTSINASQP